MGQNQCNICNNNQIDEVSMIQHQKTIQTLNSKSFKSPFSGEDFLKSVKSKEKLVNLSPIVKPKYTKRKAAEFIQCLYKGYSYRKQFNLKIKTRLKIETVKIIESLRKSYIPDIITNTMNQLKPINIEKYKQLNTGNKTIEQLFFKNKENSFLQSINKKFQQEKPFKMNFLGPSLIIYSDSISELSNKSNDKVTFNNKSTNNKQSKTINYGNRNNNILMSAKTGTHFSELPDSEKPNPYLSSFIKGTGRSFYYGQLNLKNQKNGYGYFFNEKGKYLEGFWNKNKFEGFGRIIDSKGIITEGKFKNYRLNLLGFFVNNEINGIGEKYTIDRKYSYLGAFSNSKKEGKGIEETEEYIYEGEFLGDTMHGIGKVIYKQFGDYYEGEFNQGIIEGNGTYSWKNKEVYTGPFIKGKMHGRGIYKWPKGKEFHGHYSNNLKEGKGEFIFKSGKILVCNYDKGKPIGNGILKDTVSGVQKVISQEEIKIVLKNEKKLIKELSYLDYVNSDEENNDDLVLDLCSNDSNVQDYKNTFFNNKKS